MVPFQEVGVAYCIVGMTMGLNPAVSYSRQRLITVFFLGIELDALREGERKGLREYIHFYIVGFICSSPIISYHNKWRHASVQHYLCFSS